MIDEKNVYRVFTVHDTFKEVIQPLIIASYFNSILKYESNKLKFVIETFVAQKLYFGCIFAGNSFWWTHNPHMPKIHTFQSLTHGCNFTANTSEEKIRLHNNITAWSLQGLLIGQKLLGMYWCHESIYVVKGDVHCQYLIILSLMR